jgi:hypothetical protein
VAAASSRPPPPPSPEEGEEEEEEEVERAMGMDGGIPGTSGELLRQVSSRAYGMRRHLMESLDSLAYDGKSPPIPSPAPGSLDRIHIGLICLVLNGGER